MNTLMKMIASRCNCPNSNKLTSIINWVSEKNANLKVSITRNKLTDSDTWFYDEELGEIRNKNNSFFQIRGLQQYRDGEMILEQPILIQDEIGYLGIICKEIDGVLQFLMQAKIEPGNVNKIQISPTIQATKSNFTQKHGGKKPAYLDYFLNAKPENIIVDQIQSEQSSRFLGKRNRNIIIMVDEEIEVLPSHRWMTLDIERLRDNILKSESASDSQKQGDGGDNRENGGVCQRGRFHLQSPVKEGAYGKIGRLDDAHEHGVARFAPYPDRARNKI